MDEYDRLVYRSLGVSDVLTSENQRIAAGAALLKGAFQRLDDDSIRKHVAGHPDLAQDAATLWVDQVVDGLRSHHFDPLIGDFYKERFVPDDVQQNLKNDALGAWVAALRPGLPDSLVNALSAQAYETVSAIGREDPGALRVARLELP